MIYVSSSCVRSETIGGAIRQLAENGFQNIELSGGTRPYNGLEDDLLNLKAKYGLNYLCHNYFPPPEMDFVLNIASLDETISDMSVAHVVSALRLSRKLDSTKYAFHAGFLVNIGLDEIGKRVSKRELFDRDAAVARFTKNFNHIITQASGVDVYIENNVFSQANYDNFNGVNPFFMTDTMSVDEFNHLEFKLLLDVAHLKVSCTTLGLNFESELMRMASSTDYMHVSDNDGKQDSNQGLSDKGELFSALSNLDLSVKTITLEVYSGIDQLKQSVLNVERLVSL